MSNRGKTIVCDDNKCVQGRFNPSGGASAHQRLAAAAGITPKYGAYTTSTGDVGLRSESINVTNFGTKDLSGTSAGRWVTAQITSGNVYSVKEFKANK